MVSAIEVTELVSLVGILTKSMDDKGCCTTALVNVSGHVSTGLEIKYVAGPGVSRLNVGSRRSFLFVPACRWELVGHIAMIGSDWRARMFRGCLWPRAPLIVGADGWR